MSDDEKKLDAGRLLKEVSGLSALLYVAGFISIRAWLSLLGVWSSPPLLDQTYLAEGGMFLLATAEKLIFPWALLAAVAGVPIALVVRAHRKKARAAAARTAPGRILQASAFAVAAGLTFLTRAVLLDGIESPAAVLVAKGPVLPDPSGFQWSVGVVAAVAAGWLALSRQWLLIGPAQPFVKNYLLALGCFGGFLLPIQFARTARPRTAPVAQITSSGKSSVREFLLLQTEKELVTYDGNTIRTRDRETVERIDVLCHASVFSAPSCAGAGRSRDAADAGGDAGTAARVRAAESK